MDIADYDGRAAYVAPTSVASRVEAALAAWKEAYGDRPDIVLLGFRDAMALDRECGGVQYVIHGLQVVMTDKLAALHLARVYR